MTYAIDPAMSFCEVISFYEKYIDDKSRWKKTCIFPAFSHRQILKAG